MIALLIQIIIVGLVCYCLWWLIGYIGLPAPFDKVARVIVAVVAVLFLINLVMGLSGANMSLGSIRWR